MSAVKVNTISESEIGKDLETARAIPSDSSIDPENEISGVKLILVHIGLCLSTFLVGLDSNLIATAIPRITSDFDSLADVGWYGSAFYIAMCASQPLAGKIYTLFSKKLVYLTYMIVFEIGNLICALAPSSAALIAGRAVTGLGASGVFVGGVVVLATIIPLYKRVIWQGILISIFSVASIVGPIIGGALTEDVSWQWCFWINLPFGAVAAVLILAFLNIKKPDPSMAWPLKKRFHGMDLVGFALLAGSITMLLIAVQFGGVIYPWNSSKIIGLFAGFGVSLMPLVYWQMVRGENALIPPTIFAFRNTWLISIGSIFGAGPFQIVIYWLPIWFQAVLGVSPVASGVRYLPTVIADAVTCIVGSGFVMQTSAWNPFLLLAFVMISLGGGLFTTIHPYTSDGHWIGFQIFGGIGYGFLNNVGHIGMQASLPKELVPIGASSLMMSLSAACAIFLAIGQSIFQTRLRVNLLERSISPEVIDRLVSVGVTNFRPLVSSIDLPKIIDAYSQSIAQVFYITAITPVVGFLITCGCKWTPIKKPDGPGDMDVEHSESSKKKSEL